MVGTSKPKLGLYSNDPLQGGGIAYFNESFVKATEKLLDVKLYRFCSFRHSFQSWNGSNWGSKIESVPFAFHWRGQAIAPFESQVADVPIFSSVGSPGFIPKHMNPRWMWVSTLFRDECTTYNENRVHLEKIEKNESIKLRECPHVLANSEYTQRRLWEVHKIESEVLFPPLREDIIQMTLLEMAKPRDILADGVKYISAGRFSDPRKNLPLLINAFKKVARPKDTLTLIGDNNIKISDDQITNLGLLPRHQYLESISSHDIFLLSSQIEGFGIAPLEAAALGVPIASTPCIGPEPFILNRGVVSASHKLADFADAILQLRSMIHMGFKPRKIDGYFNPALFTEKIFDLVSA